MDIDRNAASAYADVDKAHRENGVRTLRTLMTDIAKRMSTLFDEFKRADPEILPQNIRAVPHLPAADALSVPWPGIWYWRLRLAPPLDSFYDVSIRRLRAMPNVVQERRAEPKRASARRMQNGILRNSLRIQLRANNHEIGAGSLCGGLGGRQNRNRTEASSR